MNAQWSIRSCLSVLLKQLLNLRNTCWGSQLMGHSQRSSKHSLVENLCAALASLQMLCLC